MPFDRMRKVLKEDYRISITGTQSYGELGDGEETVTIDTFGTYVCRGNRRFITYKEYDEDDPNVSRTAVVKVENDAVVTMLKAGTPTRLVLEEGKRHSCVYSTQFGPISLGIYTESVRSSLGENGGKLFLDYTLDLNATLTSFNTVSVTVEPIHK
jgi:uncharacterized beta-barrel protein YwiB (DUF1934 family)